MSTNRAKIACNLARKLCPNKGEEELNKIREIVEIYDCLKRDSKHKLCNSIMALSKNNESRLCIKKWRKFRGYTQKQFAEKLFISTSSVSQIERGVQGYSDSTLFEMAEALECSIGDLLERNPDSLDFMDQELFGLIGGLNKEHKEKIRSLAETFFKGYSAPASAFDEID